MSRFMIAKTSNKEKAKITTQIDSKLINQKWNYSADK